MVKIYLVFYISIFGHPPSIMPEYSNLKKTSYLYFKDNKECENYLVNVAKQRFKFMKIYSSGNGKYLMNKKNTQFVICKALNYRGISKLGYDLPIIEN
jgi:hypothetical protein